MNSDAVSSIMGIAVLGFALKAMSMFMPKQISKRVKSKGAGQWF